MSAELEQTPGAYLGSVVLAGDKGIGRRMAAKSLIRQPANFGVFAPCLVFGFADTLPRKQTRDPEAFSASV